MNAQRRYGPGKRLPGADKKTKTDRLLAGDAS